MGRHSPDYTLTRYEERERRWRLLEAEMVGELLALAPHHRGEFTLVSGMELLAHVLCGRIVIHGHLQEHLDRCEFNIAWREL